MDNCRENIIIRTSTIGIIVNFLIAGMKIVVGAITHSLAIMTEGINNASDAINSVLTIIGTKLSNKHPDEKHPFGYGRIEYLTGVVISIIIIYAGIESFKEAIHSLINKEEMTVSIVSMVLVAISGVVKFLLGFYTEKKGVETDSQALIAVGRDSKNDSFISLITIITILIYLFFYISIDAYVGILFSIMIFRAGVTTLKDSISDIIGSKGEKELADKIYDEVRKTEGVLGAADLMLHNYGPEKYSGSINIEIDHSKTIGDIYNIIHELQLHIMHDYNVTMVFGMYAVDNDNETIKKMRKDIADFILHYDGVTSMHALYYSEKENKIYCDFIVKYELKSWDELRKNFIEYMLKKYPEKNVELTIETNFV